MRVLNAVSKVADGRSRRQGSRRSTAIISDWLGPKKVQPSRPSYGAAGSENSSVQITGHSVGRGASPRRAPPRAVSESPM